MWLDGHDLAVHLYQWDDTQLEPSIGRQHLGIARRQVAEAEVLADRDVRGLESIDQHVIDELARALVRESLVEGDQDQLPDPQAADQLRLGLEAREQLRRRFRPHHTERVGLEREHGVVAMDHLPVAEVDPVELTHRDPPRARLYVRELCDLHRRGSVETSSERHGAHPRRPTIGLSPLPSWRGSASAISPASSVSRTTPDAAPLDRSAVAGPTSALGIEPPLGEEAQRAYQG